MIFKSMDKSERTLFPEWLKSHGSAGSGRNNQSASSLQSEDQLGSRNLRQTFSNSNGGDTGRSFVANRTSSSYFQRSASMKDSSYSRSRGNFNRNCRERERERDNRSNFGDKDQSFRSDHSYMDYTAAVVVGKSNKDMLRHSVSMISRKSDVTLSRNYSGNFNRGNDNNHINGRNLMVSRGNVSSRTEAVQGKDFPTLRTEQEQCSPELKRTPSPGVATAAPNTFGSEGGASSLVEVPASVGSNSAGLPHQQTDSPSLALLANRANGLYMADAAAHYPTRASTPPQVAVDTQRLEELAIKQSRQLIPLTPQMPKPVSLSLLDKSKSKTSQHSPFLPARPNVAKRSNLSNLQALKSSWTLNGISSALKQKLSPRNGLQNPISETSSGASATSEQNKKTNPVNGHTMAAPSQRTATPSSGNLEKKLSAQVRSRKDFLNHLKKQSSRTAALASADIPPYTLENSDYSTGKASKTLGNEEDLPAPKLPIGNGCKMNGIGENIENGGETTENGECHVGVKDLDFYVPPPDEKEAEFLRSLGWEENAGDEGGLTEEEIRLYYEGLNKTTLPSEHPQLQLARH